MNGKARQNGTSWGRPRKQFGPACLLTAAASGVAIAAGLASQRKASARQREALRALQAEKDLSRRALESMSDGFILLDRDFRIVQMNAEALRLESRPASEFLGKTHWEAWPGTEHSELGRLYKRAIQEGVPVELEHLYRWPTGEAAWLNMRAFPTGDGLALFYRDVSERRRSEEHQRLLLMELNHRVKNTLAVVQCIARQSFRGDAGVAQARQAFEGRLMALSDAHNVLMRENWSSASIRELVKNALIPFAVRPDSFEMSGPDIRLAPTTAVSLALALHELSTNAAKHGALSVDYGQVRIAWSVHDGRLRITWRERGGPKVAEPPVRGFGLRMIEQGLSRELGGWARIEFDPEGVVCTLDAPLPSHSDASSPYRTEAV